ncbi:MAG: hypothetical protein M2R45_01425 [Verrucomicrobia subdivision 3 bacterium]|nr:hypothetical protein [Limisphaerales bacterium]MCS1415960.1 hypothetical protein [Limisphaerales bacterium]
MGFTKAQYERIACPVQRDNVIVSNPHRHSVYSRKAASGTNRFPVWITPKPH